MTRYALIPALTLFMLDATGGEPGSGKIEQDRAAILRMAGEFDVTFDFKETLSAQPDYKLKEPYLEHASEIVKVMTKEPNHIVLQHILLDEDSGRFVKHWKQEWIYEVMMAVNRHTLTPGGWVHEQDNVKQVEPGGKVLCRESGFNSYERTNEVDFSSVNEYWDKTHHYWQLVTDKWNAHLDMGGIVIKNDDEVKGQARYRRLFYLAKKVESGELTGEKLEEAIDEVIDEFVAAKTS